MYSLFPPDGLRAAILIRSTQGLFGHAKNAVRQQETAISATTELLRQLTEILHPVIRHVPPTDLAFQTFT